MTWPGFEPRPLDPESSALTITPSRLPHRGKITWFCLVIMRTDEVTWESTNRPRDQCIFPSCLRRSRNTKSNLEIKKTFQRRRKLSYNQRKTGETLLSYLIKEISAFDSSKHGDLPNSLGKPDSIIEAILLMIKQLVSSITTLNSSMHHSFTENLLRWRRP